MIADGDRVLVRSVPAGTPAYDQGVSAGDLIIAVNGYKVNLQDLTARMSEASSLRNRRTIDSPVLCS